MKKLTTKSKGRRLRSDKRDSGFRHVTDLQRRVDVRNERWTILVITNGKRTECDYFDGFKIAYRSSINHFEVRFANEAPRDLIPTASKLRDDSEHDEVWAVCDVDEFDVTAAILDARKLSVEIALSVPSFEVWLILHLRDGCPGFNNAKQAVDFLRGLLPGWRKENLEFTDFHGGVDEAIARSKRLGDPPEANPSTGVWRLIESLRTAHNVQP